ncbi:hypothetical protein INT45_008269 [Circinella minor]|uniref:Uncharacterized protein n=1 Tax=Circinella minor TaxID=1195481 RepID=A0A8H7S6Q2_9FUNG|nr:hypothetical protein INT45_008269 [Circinella minor]
MEDHRTARVALPTAISTISNTTIYRPHSARDIYDTASSELRSSSSSSTDKDITLTLKQYYCITDDRKSYIYYLINKDDRNPTRGLSINVYVSSMKSD